MTWNLFDDMQRHDKVKTASGHSSSPVTADGYRRTLSIVIASGIRTWQSFSASVNGARLAYHDFRTTCTYHTYYVEPTLPHDNTMVYALAAVLPATMCQDM
jgi:hypothetical protein